MGFNNNKLTGDLFNKTSSRLQAALLVPTATPQRPTSQIRGYRNLGDINNLPSSGSMYTPRTDQNKYNPMIPNNDPSQVVDHQQARIAYTGNTPEERNGGNKITDGLMLALDVMQRPQYMVTNVLEDLTDNKKDSFGDIAKGAVQGLTGKRKSNTTDVLDNLGWENDDTRTWYGKSKHGTDKGLDFTNTLRGAVGLVGDMVLDPSTYLTAGALNLAKGATKGVGKEVMEKAVMKGASRSADDIAVELATALGKTTQEIAEAAAKHGDQSELVTRLAHAFGGVDDIRPQDMGQAQYILDKGLDGINRDMLIESNIKLNKGMGGIDEGLSTAMNSRRGSVANFFARDGKGNYDINGLLKSADADEALKGQNVLDSLIDVFDPKSAKVYSDAERISLFEQVYGGTINDPNFAEAISQQEAGVIESLMGAFGSTAREGGEDMLSATHRILDNMKLKDGTYRTSDKLRKAFDTEKGIKNTLKLAEDGIEFNNGLIHAYDKATGQFFFKYSNPFTGAVKPIMDLSDKVVSDGMRKATQRILEIDPIRGVGDILGSMFKPEHIDSALKSVTNPAAYNAAKHFAGMVTDVSRKETALAKRAMRSASGLFKNDPVFMGSERLQRAAAVYMERNNDHIATAVWKTLRGEELIDERQIADIALLKQHKGWDKWYGALTDITDEELDTLMNAQAKIELFNKEILNFDNLHGVDFKDDAGTDLMRTLEGKNSESYLRRYYKSDKNAVASASALKSSGERVAGATSTVHGSAQKRSFQSTAMQRLNSPELEAADNVLTSMALREHESLRVALNKELSESITESLKSVPGMDAVVQMKQVNGLVPVTVGNLTYYAHPDIANQMARITSTITSNPGQRKIMTYIDDLTNIMKATQTSLNPSFMVKNWLGEPLMNWFAGVDLKMHSVAHDMLGDISDKDLVQLGESVFYKDGSPLYRRTLGDQGKEVVEFMSEKPASMKNAWEGSTKVNPDVLSAKDVRKSIQKSKNVRQFKIGNHEYSAADWMKVFEEQGLGWSGITRGNLVNNTQKLIQEEVQRDSASGIKKFMQTAQDSGDYVETWTRLSHFLDRVEKGMDIKAAANDVRLYHVDYKDLTAFESGFARRVMPYYTYMRKNLPIQMRMVYAQQNKMGMVGHLVDSSYRTINQDFGGEIATDDYLKEGMAIPISVDNDGNVQYLNWNLPMSDLGRLKTDMGDMMQANLIDMVHPLIRGGFELGSNTSLRFQQPIESYDGERAPLLPNFQTSPDGLPKKADYAVQQFGVVQSLRKALGQGADVMSGNPENPLKPRNAMTYALMDSVMPKKNQQNTLNNQAYNYRDQLEEQIKRLQDQGVNVPSYSAHVRRTTSGYTP